ncbi:Single-stranded DNA-binding protein [hydrothermal vent metagenome]|uniref:Single-stranded DNA-binding protein n=1 Tax=hydrothermal vent metagenome TaxID=652676 RepID=A0A3B0SPF3_9ZZZZ
MAGVNKVIIVGNLGRDPEARSMPSGDRMVTFSVATSETWKDKQSGERREKTEWHNIVIFNTHLAKVAENYLKKGSKVYLEGALQTRKYTNRDGQEVRTTEIVLQNFRGELQMLDSRGDSGGGGGYSGGGSGGGGGRSDYGSSTPSQGSGGSDKSYDMDDEVPF